MTDHINVQHHVCLQGDHVSPQQMHVKMWQTVLTGDLISSTLLIRRRHPPHQLEAHILD